MNELEKPTIKVDLDIVIPKLEPIKHNLDVIEDSVKKLYDYYSNLIFTSNQYTEAKEERAKVNKLLKAIADNRKETIKKYKEPIDDFELTSKRIEKLLEQTAGIIGDSIEKFDLEEQKKKQVVIENKIEEIRDTIIQEYLEFEKPLSTYQVIFDKRWFNKTYKDTDLKNDIRNQFFEKIEDLKKVKADANIICEFYNNIDKDGILNKEVYIERYMNTRDVNQVIEDIKRDYEIKNKKQEPTKEVLNIEVDPFAGLSINNDQMNKLHTVVFKCSDDDYKKILKYMRDLEVKIMEEK